MHFVSAAGASEKNWPFCFLKIYKLMTRKHENVSVEYCPEKDTIETIPLSRNRNLGTSDNRSKENFLLLTNCGENMRIFYAICDKTVSTYDLITQKADKLTNFRHFRL